MEAASRLNAIGANRQHAIANLSVEMTGWMQQDSMDEGAVSCGKLRYIPWRILDDPPDDEKVSLPKLCY